MPTSLTAEDARQSLNAHVESKGREVFLRYGPRLGWNELRRLLGDRALVRYPCEIAFDASALQAGELAYPEARGDRPEAGFTLYVHPLMMTRPEQLAHVVLYQLVLVNYGEMASIEDAETFGAAALGLSKETYYQVLCGLADEVST